MTNRRKLLAYATLPVLGLGLIGGATAVSAQGFGMFGQHATPAEMATRANEMFSEQAALLGISVDKVKEAWAQGKSFRDLAQENGITDDQLKEKMKTAALTHLKSNLDALVAQGVITQAQADARYTAMQTRITEGKGHKGKMMFHRGFGF